MLDSTQIKEILRRGKPTPPWRGEPLLGSVYGEEEIEAAVWAIRDSMDVSRGFGFTAKPIADFEEAFAAYIGTRHAVAINSAGPGLDMAMRYLRMEPGDEVILPAINFMAAPLAVLGAGGKVVWANVDERTFQLDPAEVEKRITPKTRAIFPVHMNGLSSPMDELLELGHKYPHPKHGPLPVITDAARACGGGYRGTKIGKKGLLTVFSLHTMKNITTLGEGGIVTTDDDEMAKFLRSARFYGADTEDWGTSNVITKVQAAVGSVQLKRLDSLIEARRRVAQQRNEYLSGLEGITLPYEPPDCRHSYYMYTCLAPKVWAGEKRDRLIQTMTDDYGAGCVVANPPAYETRTLLRKLAPPDASLAPSEELGKRLFAVSLHPSMTEADNEYIAASLIECVERLRP